jgi:hypothetical protein
MRAAFLFVILSLSSAHLLTARPNHAAADEAAIRATVTDYIEGYYLSDPVRMERSLHPRYLKHTISGSDGQLNITEKRGTDMVREVRNKKEVTPASQRNKEISLFAVDGDVASVKLVATAWTNYIILLKQDGEWKILSVVKRNQF